MKPYPANFYVQLASVVALACCVESPEETRAQVSDNKGAIAIGKPAEPHLLLRVENYSDGQCSLVGLVGIEQKGRIIDSCHGWTISNCRHILFARAQEPRLEVGKVIFSAPKVHLPAASAVLSVEGLINEKVTKEFGSYEILHLTYSQPRCINGGMELPFRGSRIGKGAQGSAKPMEGVVSFRVDATYEVRFAS